MKENQSYPMLLALTHMHMTASIQTVGPQEELPKYIY